MIASYRLSTLLFLGACCSYAVQGEVLATCIYGAIALIDSEFKRRGY